MLKPTIEELSTLTPGGYEDSRVVKSCVPINMSIMVPKAEDGSYSVLARITWLCKTYQDTLFCLTTSYVAEDQVDEEFLVSNPLLDDRYFANYKLSADILMSTLSHFLTDMNFTFARDIHKANETEISCQALEITESVQTDKLHKIMVSPEVFSTMKFVDEYMLDGIYNTADLHSAVVFGPDEENNTYIFKVGGVNIKNIAPANKKSSSNIAVKMEVWDESETNYLHLLFPIDIGKKYKKKCFNKVVLGDLTKGYLVDESQFISRFCFSAITNAAETDDYLFIKAVDYRKNGILFAFSPKIQKEITDTITSILEK